jgi:hypothetical protein
MMPRLGALLCVVAAVAGAAVALDPHIDSVSNHGRGPGPIVVLMRHGFSDHNVLMQAVR